ncbi:hypothetical protein V9Y94_23010, partial [Salmonella enterica]
MKRSDLEKDAAYILDNFKQLDYEIPSNRQILKVIFYKRAFRILCHVKNSTASSHYSAALQNK